MQQIIHNSDIQEFYIEIESERALVDYKFTNDQTVNFYHTFVPPQFRGRGYAALVVETALQWARENNYKVIPGCSYVYAFIERHKGYKSLL